MALALFDLDKTLIEGDSGQAWGQFLISKGAVDSAVYQAKHQQFYLQYHQGELDIDEYLQFALEPLTRFDLNTLMDWRGEYIDTLIKPMVRPKALELVKQHQQQGDTLLIITATYDFITEPVAELFGIEHLIATQAEQNDSGFTGKVIGTPSFQRGKVSRLEDWMLAHRQTIYGSVFYSDSHNDLPLMRMVDQPVAVDPDDRLKAIAEKYHWDILSLQMD